MSILKNHSKLEKNATLLLIASLAVVTVGGIVEIAPLFYLENTIEKVEGMRPIRRWNSRAVTSMCVKAATFATVR